MAITKFIQRLITGLVLVAFLAAFYSYAPPYILSLVFLTFLGIILATEWPRLCASNSRLWRLTPLYPITPFLLLIALNQQAAYHHLILYIFILVFSHDTACYIAGNLFGKHRMCPTVSPGKTWEGFIGGTLSTIGIALLVFPHPTTTAPLMLYVGTLCALCCISLAGDLFESWLKRNAGLKDSGTLLPGHGGLLDRFDSIMFVTVAVYILKNYLSSLP